MIFYVYKEISSTMTSINNLNLDINKSKAVYSMFVPLGELWGNLKKKLFQYFM